MLFLFSLAAIINQVGWIAFAPLSDILQKVSSTDHSKMAQASHT